MLTGSLFLEKKISTNHLHVSENLIFGMKHRLVLAGIMHFSSDLALCKCKVYLLS